MAPAFGLRAEEGACIRTQIDKKQDWRVWWCLAKAYNRS
jgi:hypothetical protein